MFIDKLSARQQAISLAYAEQIIFADGVRDIREMEMLKIVQSQCGPMIRPMMVSLEELQYYFTDVTSKKFFLLELIGFCYVDRDYHETEQELISSICDALDVSRPQQKQLEDWVVKQIKLFEDIKKLWEE